MNQEMITKLAESQKRSMKVELVTPKPKRSSKLTAGDWIKHVGGRKLLYDLLGGTAGGAAGGAGGAALGTLIGLAMKKPRAGALYGGVGGGILGAGGGGIAGGIYGARKGVQELAKTQRNLKGYKPSWAPFLGGGLGSMVAKPIPLPLVGLAGHVVGSGLATQYGAKKYLKNLKKAKGRNKR